MLNLREYRKNPVRLSELLPWAALIAEGVVLNKDGSFQQTIAYRGPDLNSATEEELLVASSHLNNILKRFDSGWALFFEAIREEIKEYPGSEWEHPLPYLIDQERKEAFLQSPRFYSKYYLTFSYLSPSDTTKRLLGRFINDSTSTNQGMERYLEQFQQKVVRASDLLTRQFTEVSLLNSEETLTYLHQTASPNFHRVCVPEIPMYLDSLLSDSPLITGTEPKLGDEYLGVIGILGFPGFSLPGMLDALNHLSFSCRWTSRFIPLDKGSSRKELEEYKRKWFAKRKSIAALIKELLTKEEAALSDSDALRKAEDVDEALLELGGEEVAFGFFTSNVVVTDPLRDALLSKVRAIESVINSCGFVTKRESFNSVEAWLGSIPGNTRPNVRRPLVNTRNVTHLFPGASSNWEGQRFNRHLKSESLLVGETSGSTPFYFSNHVNDVGHCMILGPTGSGKSTFLNFIAVQFLRYPGAQIFIFDKGRSAETMTLGVGGKFYDVAGASNLTLQPLREIQNEDERAWAQEWLLQLMEAEGISHNPMIKRSLWDALTSLATTPFHQRTLFGLSVLLQDDALRKGLFSYTHQGPYGAILDGSEDTLTTSFWQCFETEVLMETPSIVFPVLSYLFHRIERTFDGRPTLLILDEAWLFLDNRQFAGKIREWLKTLRKKNVSVVFATQSLADVDKSSIALLLKESCPTRIFLPNPGALQEEASKFYERFGLNKRQQEIVAYATPKEDYYYSSPLGNRLFTLKLNGLALAYCGGASKERQALLSSIKATATTQEEFNSQFLLATSLSEASEALAKLYTAQRMVA
jgi:type IV secretion system protein TrbE